MRFERGGLVLGLVIGLLLGLGIALAVALYVTKAPVPFVNKVPPRTADQDAAEAERNRNWDPNAGLGGRAGRTAEPAASAGTVAGGAAPPAAAPPLAAPPGTRDPAAILSGAPVAPAAAPRATTVPPGAASAAASSAKMSAKGGPEPFIYFVQVGAFQSSEEAEQQRAKIAMLGVETKLIEREQSGRTVFRVRSGPFGKQAEADALKERLADAGYESLLVRVER
jgi:cell division protein FtsN